MFFIQKSVFALLRFYYNVSVSAFCHMKHSTKLYYIIKGVLLCFFTFQIWVSVYVWVYNFLQSYKSQSYKSQSPLQREIFLFKSLFKNYSERLVLTSKCFPLFVTSQIVNPAYWNSTGWQVGRTLDWALHVSKSSPSAGVFISLYFWWKPTVFRKFWMSFPFHLACNVWKSSVCEWSSALCTALPGKPPALPLADN